MDAGQTIAKLRGTIDSALRPLIDRDFRLLEVPDYANPGDMLIFQGERSFFRTIPHHCLEASTIASFLARSPKIPKDDLLVFSGGGYFGDLWPRGPLFQKAMLERYPENPMLILPQSVFFADRRHLEESVVRYGNHPNLTICLRDGWSFEFVRNHFRNRSVLVPDMAFYADLSGFRNARPSPRKGRTLLLVREDAERLDGPELNAFLAAPAIDKADWPAMRERMPAQRIMKLLRTHPGRFGKVIDWHASHGFRTSILQSALAFLAPYETIVTTRLHGAIFGLLTEKKVLLLDNSYGKNGHLFATWLSGCDAIAFHEPERRQRP